MTTQQELFNAVLRGESDKRIPFLPRIELWHNVALAQGKLPPEYRELSQYDLLRRLGFGIYGRQASVFSRTFDGVKIVESRQGNLQRIEYHTPLGMVWATRRSHEILEQAGATYHLVEYPFKSAQDYPILAYIFEHLKYEPTYAAWLDQEKAIGEDGVSRVNASPCPLHHIMIDWMGYERAIYELYENTTRLEGLIEILTDSYRRMQNIVLDSPADLVLTGANFVTAITSPPLFRKYFLPYFADFNKRLIQRGKFPMAHVDGEIGGRNGGLMPLIREAAFKIADALTPQPVTSIRVREALDTWERRLVVWGGIPSLLTSPTVNAEEFERYFRNLMACIMPEDPFVLGIGDTVAMEANFERILHMSQLYQEVT